MNNVVFGCGVEPNAKLFWYLAKFIGTPNAVNCLNWSSAVFVPPPKVNFINPSEVYSVTNLCCVWMYFPTLTPGWSDLFVISAINTLSSASESTSYHLPMGFKNSGADGTFE